MTTNDRFFGAPSPDAAVFVISVAAELTGEQIWAAFRGEYLEPEGGVELIDYRHAPEAGQQGQDRVRDLWHQGGAGTRPRRR